MRNKSNGVIILDNNYNNFDPLGENNQNTDNNVYSSPEQTTYSSPTPNSYSPQSGYYYPQKPVKPTKKKKSNMVSAKALVACCLICAIIASAGSGVAVYFLSSNQGDGNTLSGGNTTTNITVDKQATNAVSAIAEKAVPSVVGISVTGSVDTFFGFSTDASSEGSGVIYSSDGYIITNYHVISMAVENNTSKASITVILSADKDEKIPATVVGYYSEYDLAVIKIEKEGLSAIEFADSNEVAVGDLAVAIGSPGGNQFMSSVSSGIISGLDRTLQLEGTAEMKLLQTDAAINPGNSGGALVNYNGQLVGINSSKISSEEYEGMGFAIPSNTVKKIVSDIINNKDKTYAYVGVTVSTDYTADYLIASGYPAGAVVESVAENSPADKIGIREYDIITEFNGVKISNYEEYNNERLKHNPGEEITIRIYRDGDYYEAALTLGESKN